MSSTVVRPRTKVRPKTQRPPLFKVILLNDDYTPREFVVQVLKAVFRMNEDQAYRVMITAHLRGACVIAVYSADGHAIEGVGVTPKLVVSQPLVAPLRRSNNGTENASGDA